MKAVMPPIAPTNRDTSALVAMIVDFIPFICLLTALYTITGGIRLTGRLGGTPMANAGILAVGTLLAGWIGTTGASMLMIRPLIVANKGRRNQAHVVVFFIFLVSNVGGALPPLGDPPLFLGFLRGVDFFWPLVHLTVPTAIVTAIVLATFLIVDTMLWRRDPASAAPAADAGGPYLIFAGVLQKDCLGRKRPATEIQDQIPAAGMGADSHEAAIALRNRLEQLFDLLGIARKLLTEAERCGVH